jgi:hypothetical protein
VRVDAIDPAHFVFSVVGPGTDQEISIDGGALQGFHITSRGGSGTDGSVGSDGTSGSDGSDGSDAFCPDTGGSDGSDGSSGGDGTSGGDGGNGQDGGNIQVTVICGPDGCSADTLDRIQAVVVSEGGAAGQGGRGGTGGRGGRGGAGGGGATCTDEDGSTTVLSAGSSGHDGQNGADGLAGNDGAAGKPGLVTWVVPTATGDGGAD